MTVTKNIASNNIDEDIFKMKDLLIEIRRDLHQHPELSLKEYRTSDVIFNFLKNLGLEPKKIASTGVIATIYGSDNNKNSGEKKGKTIALRADMDALPLDEKNTSISYKSQNPNVMHACGHDGHVAILLGVAKYFCDTKHKNELEKLNCNIRLIFQPAEEGFGGAKPMIDGGALKCFDGANVDAILGLHIWNMINVGEISIPVDEAMAATNEFEIEIVGKGGHAAMPHETVDSIIVATNVVTSVQTIISRNLNPLESGVITFGTINGGTNMNVIAPTVRLTGTIRAMSDSNLRFLIKRLSETVDGICKLHGATFSMKETNGYPALINNSYVADIMRNVAKDYFIEENILKTKTMGAEDFSYYTKEVPGAFFFLGSKNAAKGLIYPHHHPQFDFDEDVLPLGVQLLVNGAKQLARKI